MFVCPYVCLYVRKSVCRYVFMSLCMCMTLRVCRCEYIHTYACACVCVQVNVCMCVCVCPESVCACTCVCRYVYLLSRFGRQPLKHQNLGSTQASEACKTASTSLRLAQGTVQAGGANDFGSAPKWIGDRAERRALGPRM